MVSVYPVFGCSKADFKTLSQLLSSLLNLKLKSYSATKQLVSKPRTKIKFDIDCTAIYFTQLKQWFIIEADLRLA